MSDASPSATDGEQLAFHNLHDVFLNASLQRSMMLKHGDSFAEALKSEDRAAAFTTSDYGRFERCWVAFLYVLIEAWVHRDTADTVARIGNLVSLDRISAALTTGGWSRDKVLGRLEGCPLADMRQVRHYMAHRDQREYWDAGRTGHFGHLRYYNELHEAFSEMFLAVFNEKRRRGWTSPLGEK